MLIDFLVLACIVEPLLKDHAIGHENVVSQDRRSMVTGFIYNEMWDLLPETNCPSRQVVSHGSGLTRQVSL